MIIMDAATGVGGIAVDDGQAGNGHGFARSDVKYGTFRIAIHRKVLSAWS